MKRLLILPLLFAFAVSAFAQNPSSLQGNWKGHITIMGNPLPITTHFMADDSLRGTIDIQGTTLQLQNIRTTGTDSVFFEFVTNVNTAKFKGAFQDDSTISGRYHQAGQQFSFKLKRYETETNTVEESTKTELPYNHKNLIIKNDSINIGGTLTWPKDSEANQLVIMISGSGAQDRDESAKPITDFKPFAVLADSLTQSGITTFRYDDRGVGQSTGNFQNTSLEMLASDVLAIMNYFKTKSDQSYDEIILLGHSQGGVVAGKVAAQNSNVNKLILMGSPGVTLANVVIEQVETLNKHQNLADSVITQNIKLQKAIFDTLRGSQNFSQFPNTLPKQQLNYIQSPAYFSLLDYDPAKDLQKLDIPVLVLFGGKDTQVTVEMNKEPIEKALNSGDVQHQTEVFTNANHLFQHAKTGQVQEYGTLPSKFIEGFTTSIAEWIIK